MAGSGPLVLFRKNMTAAIVISSANNFMAHSQYYDGSQLAYGPMGSITSLPAGFTLETIIYADVGVNAAMLGWGDLLLARYGKHRDAFKRDFTLNYLGYRCAMLHHWRT